MTATAKFSVVRVSEASGSEPSGKATPRLTLTEVLTLLEASKHLRVSERTLWQLAKNNEVPHFKVGRQYRFLSSALGEWAASQS